MALTTSSMPSKPARGLIDMLRHSMSEQGEDTTSSVERQYLAISEHENQRSVF